MAPDLVKRAFFSIEITSFLDPIFSIFGSFEERERSKGKEKEQRERVKGKSKGKGVKGRE